MKFNVWHFESIFSEIIDAPSFVDIDINRFIELHAKVDVIPCLGDVMTCRYFPIVGMTQGNWWRIFVISGWPATFAPAKQVRYCLLLCGDFMSSCWCTGCLHQLVRLPSVSPPQRYIHVNGLSGNAYIYTCITFGRRIQVEVFFTVTYKYWSRLQYNDAISVWEPQELVVCVSITAM